MVIESSALSTLLKNDVIAEAVVSASAVAVRPSRVLSPGPISSSNSLVAKVNRRALRVTTNCYSRTGAPSPNDSCMGSRRRIPFARQVLVGTQ